MNIHDATETAYKRGYEDGKPKWISVKDRLPEQFVGVLIYIPDEAPLPTVHEAYNINNRTFHTINALYDFKYVTHWMPLPEPPEVNE